ncbi:hypothetical protein ACWEQ7_11060 [Streptomyces sp. NPDC004069]
MGLSDKHKVTLILSVITGVFSVVVAVVQIAPDFLKSDGKGEAAPSVQASTPPSPSQPATSAPPSSSMPSESESTPATDLSYQVVYKDEKMSLGLPDTPNVYAIDFDAPSARRYSEKEWDAMKAKAEETGTVIEPDLSYYGYWGYLTLRDGRNAAELSADEAPTNAEDCARRAQLGGFTDASMYEWKIPVKTVFCLVTDKGNVVRAQITRLVGDRGNTRAPEQIDLQVTMWKRAA